MKKVLSLAAAGALLLSMATVAFASVSQFSFTHSTTTAESVSGLNTQSGKGSETIYTGNSGSAAIGITAGNVNVGGKSVSQGAFTGSATSATSVSGENSQTGGSHKSSQVIGTGGSYSLAGSLTVSNVNISLGR